MFILIVPAILLATMMMGALADFVYYDPIRMASVQSAALNLLERVQNAAELTCKAGCADGAPTLTTAQRQTLNANASALNGSIGSVSINGNVISWFTYTVADKNVQLMAPTLQMSDAARSTLGQYSASLAAARGYGIRTSAGVAIPGMNLAIPVSAGVPDKAVILALHR